MAPVSIMWQMWSFLHCLYASLNLVFWNYYKSQSLRLLWCFICHCEEVWCEVGQLRFEYWGLKILQNLLMWDKRWMSYFLTHLSCIAIQRMKTADATKDHTFKTLGFFNFDTDTAMLPGIGIILCDERIFTDLCLDTSVPTSMWRQLV